MGSTTCKVLAGVLAAAGTAVLSTASGGSAQAAPAAAVAPIDPAVLGTTQADAAGSCWEIKQVRPAAPSGDYWLLTPKMSAPQEFYCDMVTDGGGWVLIGKGREGWTSYYEGKGQASALLSPDMAMGPQAHQLGGHDVDALLNGQLVSTLPDGVRIRRAANSTGTQWQEARVRFAKMRGWAWTFGSQHPLAGYSFDGAPGSGGSWQSFGSGQLLTRMVTTTNSGKNFRYGYGYGSSIAGFNNNTSYLWAEGDGVGGALPYAQVYLRPQVLSTDPGFTPIPDDGTEPVERTVVPRSTAMVTPWGVSGIAGSTGREGSVEVQAMTQSGNNMYVGGNFAYVQRDAAGTGRVNQPFLAAFDIDTGEWISGFRPTLNEQVRSLTTLPDGTVVAGGDFSQANGQPATAIVALNPTTGATRSTWNVRIENRTTAGTLMVRTLDVSGAFVYIGGSMTHFSGGSTPNTARYMRNLGRVSVANGTPSSDWNPDLNGTVVSIDGSDDTNRTYAAGYFDSSQGNPSNSAAAIQTASGASLATPTWAPVWSSTRQDYQQGVMEVGDRVWIGGSEHNFFSYDTSTFQRLSGEIANNKGGDVQAVAASAGVVYQGNHASDMTYSNAFFWPTMNSDWTEANTVKWAAAFDASTGARIPDFVPTMSLRLGSGIWAIEPDTNGTIWMGGDITNVQTNQGGRFSGGFARFPMQDSTAPGTPASFRMTSETATTATLEWGNVTDASGGIHYQVLRDDRTVAATTGNTRVLTVPKSETGRYFIRAVDGEGNVGASSNVLVLGSGEVPPTAAFTWSADREKLSVDGSTSSSATGNIVGWSWNFGDGSTANGATATHSYATGGDYLVTLTVTDDDGNASSSGQSVTVGNPPNPSPTDLYGAEVFDQVPWAYYRLNEAGGTTAADAGPDGRNGTYSGSISYRQPGALVNTDDPGIATNGFNGFVASPRVSTAPTEFTIGVWFRTTSLLGGRLIGYGNSNSGDSTQYDRHLYITNNGQIVFGAYNGAENRVTSPGTYRDGSWHYATASLSPTVGMRLYMDGQLVDSNPNTTAENFLGYWRVGGDSLWSGASSRYLAGNIDEGVVYLKTLTAAQVAEQWRLGATSVTPPANTAPTAHLSASMNQLAGSFDASASTDAEGPLNSFSWDFGDGGTGTGQTPTHTYAAAGDYDVTVTVTDAGGLTDTATETVTAVAPPVTEVVVANGANWRYRYETAAPPTTWKDVDFDATSWDQGDAVLGFGATAVATDIDDFATPQDRARAAYFRRAFQVSDASRVTQLALRSVADDGVVIYVNGVEVTRSNMPTGTITHTTYAPSAQRTAVANASPVLVDVPLGLLRNGTNVIAAETHLNYRNTTDFTFDLRATMTSQQAAGPPADPIALFTVDTTGQSVSVDAGTSYDPDGVISSYAWTFGDGADTGRVVNHHYAVPGDYDITLTATDNSGRTASTTRHVSIAAQPATDVVIPAGSDWRWRYATAAPPADWNARTFDASAWNLGAGAFGWGAPIVVTNIDTFADPTDRPRTAYFTKSFQVSDASDVTRLLLESAGDDGAVVYVNGTEVARSNMPTGAITHTTYALSGRRYTVAANDPISVEVPLGLLVDGTNTVAVETHLNYRRTTDLTFDLLATLTHN
ncbi:PKD domain-containing protein [Nocardioides jensenii]|uniref:PKD domain-containing protein n=1 Tax=Nocardioides jensenii TaxID=1843 RepID=UPI000AB00F7F|nr:PKD domain-containing protein [Nocardioides jensenii]